MEVQMYARLKNEDGVVLLLSVLIAMVVGVAIGISLILGGLILSQGSQADRESKTAKSLANGCVEVAFEQIRNNTAYSGSSSATINGQICNYTVTTGAGEVRTITTNATSGNSTARVTTQISTINPKIIISSWQEL